VITIKKYVSTDDLFFDITVNDNQIFQFLSVKDELTAWSYKKGEWNSSETFPFNARNFFITYALNDEIIFINARGEVFHWNEGPVRIASKNLPLTESNVIVDRDRNEAYLVSQIAFTMASSSMRDLIAQYGQKIN